MEQIMEAAVAATTMSKLTAAACWIMRVTVIPHQLPQDRSLPGQFTTAGDYD
jgi:hypothetical protein